MSVYELCKLAIVISLINTALIVMLLLSFVTLSFVSPQMKAKVSKVVFLITMVMIVAVCAVIFWLAMTL
jgi:hypothetical protein